MGHREQTRTKQEARQKTSLKHWSHLEGKMSEFLKSSGLDVLSLCLCSVSALGGTGLWTRYHSGSDAASLRGLSSLLVGAAAAVPVLVRHRRAALGSVLLQTPALILTAAVSKISHKAGQTDTRSVSSVD